MFDRRTAERSSVEERTTPLLRSTLARRVLGLFLLCSLIPCGVFGTYSLIQLRGSLIEQAEWRMQDEARSAGHRLLNRLLVARSTLSRWRKDGEKAGDLAPLLANRDPGFERARVWVEQDGAIEASPDEAPSGAVTPRLTEAERAWIARGEILLSIDPATEFLDGRFRWLAALGDPEDDRVLVAELDATDFLADEPSNLGETPLTLLHRGRPVHVIGAELPVDAEWVEESALWATSGEVRTWSGGDREVRGTTWTLPLSHQFGCPPVEMAVGLPLSEILQPVRHSWMTFALLAVLTALFTVLISGRQIRSLLTPLEILCQGTRRLAEAELSSRIEITTGDEFESLATDFNRMAARLERQFEVDQVSGAIHNAVLSTIDAPTIIRTVLARLPALVPGASIRFVEFVTSPDGSGMRVDPPGNTSSRIPDRGWSTTRMQGFLRAQTDPWLEIDEDRRWLAESLGLPPEEHRTLFPMVAGGRLVATLSVDGRPTGDGERRRVRQVAEHVLVALENARLVADLNRMSWGTLRTLARAVDAKSPWTAGHSERVARLACAVARELGMGQEDQDRIFRGGLLHDLGKIATPVEILDKDGPLTPEEKEVIEQHVIVGEEILKPIEEYASLLPIVRSHHERWDGKGYPDRLRGTLIPIDARVLAVADVFDALVSDRPYRQGMDVTEALEIIMTGAGSHFDAECAQALWRHLSKTPSAEDAAHTEEDHTEEEHTS